MGLYMTIVAVQFYHWFNVYFSLFFFMLIYDNEHETKENKSEARIKLNYDIYIIHVGNFVFL